MGGNRTENKMSFYPVLSMGIHAEKTQSTGPDF